MASNEAKARSTVDQIQDTMTLEQLKKHLKNTPSKKYFRILSIDGGGIRGVLPGMVMVKLEQLLQQVSGDPDARLAHFFDLIAGTSTGGILTSIYLCPNADGTKPKYSAQDAVNLYLKNGGEIFTRTLGRKIKTIWGVSGAKYSAKPIEKYLTQFLGDVKLSDVQSKKHWGDCLITNFNMTTGAPSFFTSFDVGTTNSKGQSRPDYLLRDAARSTSAAPTYFPPAWVSPIGSNTKNARIDGGTFANNPTMAALVEALKMEHDTEGMDVTFENISIISVGTKGGAPTTFEYDKVRKWGLAKWVQPIISIMMNGVSETTDYQLDRLYGLMPHFKEYRSQYLRIEPDRGKANPAMDDASPKNLQLLKEAGQAAANEAENALIHSLQYIFSGREDEFPNAFA